MTVHLLNKVVKQLLQMKDLIGEQILTEKIVLKEVF